MEKIGIHGSSLNTVQLALHSSILSPYSEFIEQLSLFWQSEQILAVHAGRHRLGTSI